jgi:hypothetical protein
MKGYFRVFKPHRHRTFLDGRDVSEEVFCAHEFSV